MSHSAGKGLPLTLLNTSSFVYLALRRRSLQKHQFPRWVASSWNFVCVVSEIYSSRTVRSAYFITVVDWWTKGICATYRENRNGLRTQPCELPVDALMILDVLVDVITFCFRSVRNYKPNLLCLDGSHSHWVYLRVILDWWYLRHLYNRWIEPWHGSWHSYPDVHWSCQSKWSSVDLFGLYANCDESFSFGDILLITRFSRHLRQSMLELSV